MKNKKILAYFLLIIGSGLGLITLIFSPIAMIGAYILLNQDEESIKTIFKVIFSIIIGLAIPLILATIVSFMLY